MRWLSKAALRVQSLVRRERVDAELDDELRFHVEQQIAENMAAGMSCEEARRAAVREFGGVDQIREECSDMRRVGWLQDFVQDLRYGLRVLRKSPGFTAVAIITLALGIGANTAIFSAVNTLLLRALPVTDSSRLVLLEWHSHEELRHSSYSNYGDCQGTEQASWHSGCSFSQPLFEQLRSKNNVFSGLTAFAGSDGLDLSGNGPASKIDSAEYVSGEYFETLGVRPAAGRLISAMDDALTAPRVAVLSYALWKSNFGGSPAAVGKTILLNRVPLTIIGVAEPRFDALSPGNTIQIWLPLSKARELELPWDNRDVDSSNWWLVLVGRLKPGIALSQAQAAADTLFRNEVTHGAKPSWKPEDHPSLALVPAQQGLTGFTTDISAPLYVLMLAVGTVLLIACANVAGLLLSRATARYKEIALRFALGARRGRIVRQLLTESLLLSIAGGAVGLLFAQWIIVAIRTFMASAEENPGAVPLIDARALIFTAAISILTGVLFGLAPAFRGIRVDLTPALKDAGSTSGARTGMARWFSMGNALVVAQVALTMVVLVGAGLLVRTLQNLKMVNPGFDTRNLLTFRLEPALAGYTQAQTDTFFPALQERLAAIPGVISVSYSWRPLLAGGLWTTDFPLPGMPKDKRAEADMLPVSSNFFTTMRVPLRLGREFDSADFEQAQRVAEVRAAEDERIAAALKGGVKGLAEKNKEAGAGLPAVSAIVNEAFLHKYFPKAHPVGIRFGEEVPDETNPRSNPGWEIVGVVGDAKYNNLRRDVQPTIYVPSSSRAASFTLRTALDPAAYIPQVRSVVSQMDNNLPVFRIRTERQQIDEQLLKERLIARLSGFFGVLALVLACIGLYGLLSYEVTRRTREIGIRMALGAHAQDVLRMVIRGGIVLAAVGAIIGIGVALGVTRFLASLLYAVRPADPITLAGVAVLLAAVATLACYLPARRATRVDPLVALRYE